MADGFPPPRQLRADAAKPSAPQVIQYGPIVSEEVVRRIVREELRALGRDVRQVTTPPGKSHV